MSSSSGSAIDSIVIDRPKSSRYMTGRGADPDPEHTRLLVESNMDLARKITNRWCGRNLTFRDDIESQACWALWIAARGYVDGTGMEFRTFAYKKINWTIITLMGSLKSRLKYRMRVAYWRQPDPIIEDHPCSIHAEEDFEQLIAHTIPSNREILRLLFRDGLSWKEAGKVLGMSNQAVGRKMNDAMRDLRAAIRSGVT